MTQPAHYQWRRTPFIANRWLRYGIWLVSAAYLVWAVATLEFDWARIEEGMTRAVQIFDGAFPLDYSRWELLISGFIESIQIAIIATIAGILLSIPAGILAARNIVPRFVYLLGRAIVIVARSFHPVIVAIIFVKAVGFGPLAGILTLIVYTVGFVGKLIAESIEEIDPGQVEAIKATGAGYFKTLTFAVFPQIMPRQVGLTIYQFDINLRASTIVGIVGAGGIGGTLMNSFRRYDYDFSFAILSLIIALVIFGEWVSGKLRKRIT
ncbi:MAG TPA: phosphonate ABC transporter, permease protein PhnE [Trueperaceae bacterium]